MNGKNLLFCLTLCVTAVCVTYGNPLPGMNFIIGSFNIQTLGPTKMGRPEFVDQVVKILSRYDIVLVQEVRDVNEKTVPELVRQLNIFVSGLGITYDFIISPRLGLGTYKEQLTYIYRKSNLMILRYINVVYEYMYDNPLLTYDRPPYVAKFRIQDPLLSIREFVLMNLHLRPTNVFEESKELRDAVDRHLLMYDVQENIAIIGDYNFDCSYITATNRDIVRGILSDFTWYIMDKVATTISTSNCAYDRIIINSKKFKDAVIPFSNNTYRYDYVYNLNLTEVAKISDHFPIEFQLK